MGHWNLQYFKCVLNLRNCIHAFFQVLEFSSDINSYYNHLLVRFYFWIIERISLIIFFKGRRS